MQRRRYLALGGGVALTAGCLADPGTPQETTVGILSRDPQPDIPAEYDAEMLTSRATDEQPPRFRVSITNQTDGSLFLGEERDVQFHHAHSDDMELYLYPAEEETWDGPVEPGCWRMTEYVAVPEYYGVIEIEAGETRQAESYVYGHPSLPDGVCLPEGEHRLSIEGVTGEQEDDVLGAPDPAEFEWGVTLRISEG